jgi:hypothetical protein
MSDHADGLLRVAKPTSVLSGPSVPSLARLPHRRHVAHPPFTVTLVRTRRGSVTWLQSACQAQIGRRPRCGQCGKPIVQTPTGWQHTTSFIERLRRRPVTRTGRSEQPRHRLPPAMARIGRSGSQS